MKIDISKIKIGKRIRQDPGDIDEFAQSITEYGLFSPILLRKIDEYTYKLLDGWRRIQAYKLLKITSIDAIIKKEKIG